MNDDTVVLGRPHEAEVRDYVTRVRVALNDLTSDDVDELTLGMEADLGEIRAEVGDLTAHLGTPERYAAELRAAADLPARPAATAARRTRLADVLARIRTCYDAYAARHEWLRTTATYLGSLRPAWWLLRAILGVWVLIQLFGTRSSLLLALFLIPAVPASVWLGRHRDRLPLFGRPIVLVLNALGSIIALGFVTSLLATYTSPPSSTEQSSYEPPLGLWNNGSAIDNIFVYDAEGHPVPRARLYDDTGAPIQWDPSMEPSTPGGTAVDRFGHTYINVFPRRWTQADPWHPDTADGSWAPPAEQPALLPVQPSPDAGESTSSAPPSAPASPSATTSGTSRGPHPSSNTGASSTTASTTASTAMTAVPTTGAAPGAPATAR